MAKGGSAVLLEEYFSSGDDRFLSEVRSFGSPEKLGPFAERWFRDPRPWAREQILKYLEHPLDRPGHQPLVKRLFKQAEAARNHELMAAFLVAFDRLVRRRLVSRTRYDWQSRQTFSETRLITPSNTIPLEKAGRAMHHRRPSGGWRLFSYHTRYYLRRRAWRYFRFLGYQHPREYLQAAAGALVRYLDEDLARGENILDSWGLLHMLFHHSEALEFGTSHILLKGGRRLGDVEPAPRFPDLWSREEAFPVIFDVLTNCRSRLVRACMQKILRQQHDERLRNLSPDEVLRLLDHQEEEVQQFGAVLLENLAGIGKLTLEQWLRLVETRNVTVLHTICDVMKRNVSGDRLTLEQCVDLARAGAAPVARMGLEFLQGRNLKADTLSGEEGRQLRRLAGMKCDALAGDVARWALDLLGAPAAYERDSILPFFDSLREGARRSACSWLREGSPGYDDAALWSALLETPHDDVRHHLIRSLEARAALPGSGTAELTPLWCSVLLGVQRGGREKLQATRQIGRALVDDPACGDDLLPVLAAALRSVRAPERRAALAAVVSAVEARPDLGGSVAQHLPELNFMAGEAAK